ncbi:protein translocase subunit SecD [Corynebacterium sp. TAE3-ERU12]|nr:protein translocase subunit SecD [Corynebacterium sp. TAE3-ERU12]
MFGIILVFTYALVLFTGDRNLTPKLGIDLQGGTRVTLVPQGQEPSQEQLEQARRILENRVNGMGVSGAEVVTDGNTLVITVPGSDSQEARQVGQTSKLYFRPVMQPQSPAVDEMESRVEEVANQWVAAGIITPEQANKEMKELADNLNETLKQQREQFKEADPEAELPPDLARDEAKPGKVTAKPPKKAANSIERADLRKQAHETLLQTRQSDDPTTLFAAAALMQCENPEAVDPLGGGDDPAKPLVTCDPDASGRAMLLAPAPLLKGEKEGGKRLSGDAIDTNSPITGGLNQDSGQMEVSFRFKSDNGSTGAATWTDLTTEYLQQQIAIVLDSQVISAPVIRSATPVGSATAITGDFTSEEAQALANNLRYGALPLSFAGKDGERGGTATTIPASLGAASLQAGLLAALIGIVLIVCYALLLYRALGAISVVSLAASGAMVYGVLILLGRWIGYSLDLAGIAGIVISIGTTADSFIVFFERIKDEIRDGRTFRSAVPHAWRRAKRTIWSGNFVSIIAAVVLYILAVGDVKGFAFTLGLSTTFDIITAFLVTAPLVIMASRKPAMAKPSMNGFGSVMDLARKRGAVAPPEHSSVTDRYDTADEPTVGTATKTEGSQR